MEHAHKVIFRTKNGVVSSCPHCSELNLEYGNFAVCLNPEELQAFLTCLKETKESQHCETCQTRNDYYFTFENTPFKLGFTQIELKELFFLLETSEMIRAVESGQV